MRWLLLASLDFLVFFVKSQGFELRSLFMRRDFLGKVLSLEASFSSYLSPVLLYNLRVGSALVGERMLSRVHSLFEDSFGLKF